MTTVQTRAVRRRGRPRSRLAGYVMAVIVNAALLVLVDVRPGWAVVPFLTDDFVRVLWLVNLSLAAGAVVNLAYLGYDRAWFKSVGEIGVAVIGFVLAVRMWQVFPFDLTAGWSTVARVLLSVAVVGSVVAVLTELARLGRRDPRRQA